VTYVYDDVTYVYDDVTYVYDDVTYVCAFAHLGELGTRVRPTRIAKETYFYSKRDLSTGVAHLGRLVTRVRRLRRVDVKRAWSENTLYSKRTHSIVSKHILQ
jgi:hypothetical protein